MVRKDERKESMAEFLACAMELEKYTFKKCLRFPNRYKEFKIMLMTLAINIMNNVKTGNSIFVSNDESFARRQKCFTLAGEDLQCMATQLTIIVELIDEVKKEGLDKDETPPKITNFGWAKWGDLIDKEITLLSNIKKSDRERYKNPNSKSKSAADKK